MAIKWIEARTGFRQGYYLVPNDKMLVGPFKTVEEAREALGDEPASDEPGQDGNPDEKEA